MKRGATNHPKMDHLAELLGCSRFEAIGIMTLLWEWTGDYAVQGDIGKFTNAQIARAIGYADCEKLVRALIDSGFVDEHEQHRLVIHDWQEHCEAYVRKRLERQGLRFIPNGSQRLPKSAKSKTTAADGSQRLPRARVKARARAKAGLGQGQGEGRTTFQDFWSAWPKHFRKTNKAECRKSWDSHGCNDIASEVLAGLERWKSSGRWSDPQYIPAPLVWLNQERWTVELEAFSGSAGGTAEPDGFDILKQREMSQGKIA